MLSYCVNWFFIAVLVIFDGGKGVLLSLFDLFSIYSLYSLIIHFLSIGDGMEEENCDPSRGS